MILNDNINKYQLEYLFWKCSSNKNKYLIILRKNVSAY